MELTPEERQQALDDLRNTEDEPRIIKYKEWQDPADGSIWAVDDQYNKIKMLAGPVPGWEYNKGVPPPPPRAPQRAPQTQAEMDADAARARLYAAQATGAERDLQNPYILKQQQVAEAIQSIQEQMARGEITPDEANKMMMYARQNLDAAMRGTTPFQMEQDRLNREQTRRSQQQNLAQNFVADRAQMSGNMATGLLSGLGGIYGKIYSSTNPPAIDPFALASGYTDQAYGGPELNDMALALLRSALGQGGM